MLEIRFHGRGGQGAVTSAELLAQAAIEEGKYARAFPSFGPERRGAPVSAFCRIDDNPVTLRTSIDNPNVVIVLDPSLFSAVDVTRGIQKDGYLVINTKKDPKQFMFKGLKQLAFVNATQIAQEILNRPITNTVLLGAFLKLLPVVKVESLISAVQNRFSGKIAILNVQALERAYEEAQIISSSDVSFEQIAQCQAKTSKEDFDYLWTELAPGLVVHPGSSRNNFTGDWRSCLPVMMKERCIQCGLCWAFCPDAAQKQDSEGYFAVDLDYCKGCGICAKECPTGAIHMEKELEL
ncbi:MAG: pyruvate ferredoxin oxidoreductase subunit gamma [Candidatus Contubernalis sp.]|nr:pyruvate ferredoxin oxidoreductase subunit gamma [Candidatus Contubernalis sp.]